MKGLAQRLQGEGLLVSLLDEDGEIMIVYGGDGPGGAVSLYGYWGELGAVSNVVHGGQSLASVGAEALEPEDRNRRSEDGSSEES